MTDLENYICGEIHDLPYDGGEHDFSEADRRKITIRNSRLYLKKVLRINYTTDDCRREQDSINVRTQSNIVTISYDADKSTDNLYWYGKVIGIFWAEVYHQFENVCYPSSDSVFIDIVWVRWYGRDSSVCSGWKARRLPRIGFDPGVPLGFIHPSQILRGAHLIPAFHHGQTDHLFPPSKLARRPEDNDKDWQFYYVNM